MQFHTSPYIVFELSLIVRRVPVSESYRASFSVVNIDHQVLDAADGPFLAHHLSAVQSKLLFLLQHPIQPQEGKRYVSALSEGPLP